MFAVNLTLLCAIAGLVSSSESQASSPVARRLTDCPLKDLYESFIGLPLDPVDIVNGLLTSDPAFNDCDWDFLFGELETWFQGECDANVVDESTIERMTQAIDGLLAVDGVTDTYLSRGLDLQNELLAKTVDLNLTVDEPTAISILDVIALASGTEDDDDFADIAQVCIDLGRTLISGARPLEPFGPNVNLTSTNSTGGLVIYRAHHNDLISNPLTILGQTVTLPDLGYNETDVLDVELHAFPSRTNTSTLMAVIIYHAGSISVANSDQVVESTIPVEITDLTTGTIDIELTTTILEGNYGAFVFDGSSWAYDDNITVVAGSGVVTLSTDHLTAFMAQIVPTNPCEVIHDNCATCDAGLTTCYSCTSGTTDCCLDDQSVNGSNECTDCSELYDDDCIECNPTECTKCGPGTYLDDSYNCVSCATVTIGCTECSDEDTCTECDTGYYLNDDPNSCLACLDGCDECDSSTSCVSCSDGLDYTELNTCVASNCPSVGDCVTCDGGSAPCLACASGYSFDGTNCVLDTCSDADIVGCVVCSDPAVCTQCASSFTDDGSGGCDCSLDYVTDEGECVSLCDLCESCEADGTCDCVSRAENTAPHVCTCEDRYFELNGRCFGPVPEVEVDISGPTEVNLACSTDDVTLTIDWTSADNSLTYLWSLPAGISASPVNEQTLTVLHDDLVVGTHEFDAFVYWNTIDFEGSHTLEVIDENPFSLSLTSTHPDFDGSSVSITLDETPFDVTVNVDGNDCGLAVSYSWVEGEDHTRRRLTHEIGTSATLEVVAAELTAGSSTIFCVDVTVGTETVSACFLVHVGYQDLTVSIDNAAGEVPNDADLVLSGTGVDPDGVDATLEYTWECTSGGSACEDPSTGPLLDNPNDNPTTIVAADLTPGAEYTFTLTVYSDVGDRETTSDSVTITVAAALGTCAKEDATIMTDASESFYLTGSDFGDDDFVSTTWTQTAGEAVTPVTINNLAFFAADTLTPGTCYSFTFEWELESGDTGSEEWIFYANPGPADCTLDFYQYGSTKWLKISVLDCTDEDTPLTYELYRGGIKIRSKSTYNYDWEYLRFDDYEFTAIVCDSEDSCSTFTDDYTHSRLEQIGFMAAQPSDAHYIAGFVLAFIFLLAAGFALGKLRKRFSDHATSQVAQASTA